jgi:DnaJ-class molecular chaperone
MKKKTFEPKKYGMSICPSCNGGGYIENPKRQCCPKCGGFGFLKRGPEDNVKPSEITEKRKGGPP